jgi:hypothetical protein
MGTKTMTNIDNTLLNAAKITGDHAENYGDHVAFWDKSAQLASIKLGRVITGYDMVMIHIAHLETKIANRWDHAEHYAEITSLHAIASLYIVKNSVKNMLDHVEQDIKDMAAKLVNTGENNAQ